MRVTEGSLWAGISAARLGGRVTDISHAVESYVRSQAHPTGGDFGILEDFTGHGIGTAMHQPPNVPNYGRPGRGPKLERGLALAVEPMVTLGSKYAEVGDDGWTVVTEDGSWSAHFEHSLHPDPERRLDPDRPRRGQGQARRARGAVRRGLSGYAVKPFLLLSIRPERAAADNEYESFLRFTGLDEAELPADQPRPRRAARPRPRRVVRHPARRGSVERQ